MAGRIGFADVGLDFDDDAAGANAAAVVDEDLAEQIAGDVERRAIVERSGQFHGASARAYRGPRGVDSALASGATARSAARATCWIGIRRQRLERRRSPPDRRRAQRVDHVDADLRVRIEQLVGERRRPSGRDLDQIALRLFAQRAGGRASPTPDRSRRSRAAPTQRRRPASRWIRAPCRSPPESPAAATDRRPARALRSRCARSAAVLLASCAVNSGTLAGVRDARQRVERGFRRRRLCRSR